MRRLLATNMLYSFIAAALGVMVPLYLVERKVDIAYIGLMLALGPITFTIIRTYLASVADEIGTRLIGLLYACANLVAIGLYAIFPTAPGFTAGIFGEGVRTAGFWAIARTETISESKGHPGSILAYFSAMRQLGDGLGRLAGGLLLAYLAFIGSFALFFALSLGLLALVYFGGDGKPAQTRHGSSVRERVFKRRGATFWHAALLELFAWLPYNMLLGFLLPVYLVSSLNAGYQETGGLVALLSLVIAGSAIISSRWNIRKGALIWLTLLVVPSLALIPVLPSALTPLLLVTALGMGCMSIVAEYILVDQVYRSTDVSTDIGVFFTPLKVGEFLFLCASGFVITHFGYVPLFAFCALSTLAFVVLALRLMPQG